jgi:hypothetical protein
VELQQNLFVPLNVDCAIAKHEVVSCSVSSDDEAL